MLTCSHRAVGIDHSQPRNISAEEKATLASLQPQPVPGPSDVGKRGSKKIKILGAFVSLVGWLSAPESYVGIAKEARLVDALTVAFVRGYKAQGRLWKSKPESKSVPTIGLSSPWSSSQTHLTSCLPLFPRLSQKRRPAPINQTNHNPNPPQTPNLHQRKHLTSQQSPCIYPTESPIQVERWIPTNLTNP